MAPPFRCVFPLRFWKDHSVDHVNDAVVGDEIGFHDFGVIDRHPGVGHFEIHGLTLDGSCLHGFHISGHDFARDNMVGKNGDELLLVFGLEQIFDRIAIGGGRQDDLRLITSLGQNIEGKSHCALGDALVMPIRSAMKKFPEEFEIALARGKKLLREPALTSGD